MSMFVFADGCVAAIRCSGDQLCESGDGVRPPRAALP